METHTIVRPPPPTPCPDRLLMVVRRHGEVLARWALPAHASMGAASSAAMALPVGLGAVRGLEVALLPGGAAVQLKVQELGVPGHRPAAARPQVVELGEPVPVGRCTVTFFPGARDAGSSTFDRAAPTLALGPTAGDVEQDLVETRLVSLPRIEAGEPDWRRRGQRAALRGLTALLWLVARLARLGGGWLQRRCGAQMCERGAALERP